jgi:hypothetical protein
MPEMVEVTAIGYESRAGTRTYVGCGPAAAATADAIEALGHKVRVRIVNIEDDPRSELERDRSHRLMDEIAPLIFGKGNE